MDELENKPMADNKSLSGNEYRSFLLDENVNDNGSFDLLESKKVDDDNAENVILQSNEIEKNKYSLNEGLYDSLGLPKNKISALFYTSTKIS